MEANAGSQIIVGSSALSFRRDNMDIQNIFDNEGVINLDALD